MGNFACHHTNVTDVEAVLTRLDPGVLVKTTPFSPKVLFVVKVPNPPSTTTPDDAAQLIQTACAEWSTDSLCANYISIFADVLLFEVKARDGRPYRCLRKPMDMRRAFADLMDKVTGS